MEAIIPNPKNLARLKAEIKKTGYQNLHILSDFDRTLTYEVTDGVKTPSVVSMLRQGNYLTKGYAEKANKLFDKYYPMERDPNISFSERKRVMQEWWETHDRLLIKSGLSKLDLKNIVRNGHVKFREGVSNFLDLLHGHNVPLIVFSASNCGDAIPLFFQKINRDYANVFYVINQFNWGSNGKAVSTRKPIMHSLNKDKVVLEKIPDVYQSIKNRRNVILLGDNLGDLGMIEGFAYSNLLKIGFLNPDQHKLKEDYKKNFDVVLEGDGGFDFMNILIKDLA